MKQIKLDGKKSGFYVEIESENKEKKYINTSNGIRIFDNFEIAKITANRFSSGKRFKYWIKIDDNTNVAFDDTISMPDGTYQVALNGELISIKEKRNYTTTKVGYCVFYNGDKERTNNNYAVQKELYDIIKWTLEVLLLNYTGDFGLVSITKKPGEIIGHIEGTTSKIHIVKLSRLMELNTARRNENKRVFPFIKDMDKYTTFYIYTSKDASESKNLRGGERIESIFDRFFALIQQEFPSVNCRFVPVDYSGYVEVED